MRGLILTVALCATARAQLPQLEAALDEVNLTVQDLRFDKDHGKPLAVMPLCRKLLDQPLEGPALARRQRDWSEPAELLAGAKQLAGYTGRPSLKVHSDDPLEQFKADAALFGWLDKMELQQRKSSALPFLDRYLEDDALAATLRRRWKLSEDAWKQYRASTADLDPEPEALRFHQAMQATQTGALINSGERLRQMTHALHRAWLHRKDWPEQPRIVETKLGLVVIGTTGDDLHHFDESPLLIFDPGGNDRYSGAAQANLLRGQRVSVIVDLAGDDLYEHCGGAVHGFSWLLDLAGNDRYTGDFLCQGAAAFGCAGLEDLSGDDHYEAGVFAQGAGSLGLGLLWDAAGDDLYQLGHSGQAFAGVLGQGYLVDLAGNDRYLAGGLQADTGHHDTHFQTFAQGFSIGWRPFFGGGHAALIDKAGDDHYVADVWGQGCSYWYSSGMLIDAGGGRDFFHAWHYAQGCGIHLSTGLLMNEGGGDDYYSAYALAQGAAHDYGVGWLLEGGGNDRYTADHACQGSGINNSFALLHETGGDDHYQATQAHRAQGAGDYGGHREYEGISLLIDAAGRDHYSGGDWNGAVTRRPHHGLIHDTEARP